MNRKSKAVVFGRFFFIAGFRYNYNRNRAFWVGFLRFQKSTYTGVGKLISFFFCRWFSSPLSPTLRSSALPVCILYGTPDGRKHKDRLVLTLVPQPSSHIHLEWYICIYESVRFRVPLLLCYAGSRKKTMTRAISPQQCMIQAAVLLDDEPGTQCIL